MQHDRNNNGCYEINHMMAITVHPTTCRTAAAAANHAFGRGGEKGTTAKVYPHFARADCYAQPIVHISHEQQQLTALAPIPIDQPVNLIAAETKRP